MTIDRRTLMTSALALGASAAFPVCARAAAPLQGVAPAAMHRYKIGAFEVTALLDGVRPGDGPHKIFGVNQNQEHVAELLEKNHLPTEKFVNGFTPVVVNTGSELVLFDTGLGAGARPDLGRLRGQLAAAGLSPEQIDVVVITHCHPDHIGGLMEDGRPLAPNARYVMGEAEYAFWSAPERLSGPTENAAKLTQVNVVPLADRMTFVKGEAGVVPGIRAVETFGHTPGHLSFHVESQGKRLLIGGDFCNHYVLSLQRPDWHVSFDADKDQAAATRRTILDMLATDRMPFTGYHMPFPSVGYVEKAADGSYRFVPATYQLYL